jgi:DNA-binding MarR family transcriptional regulator
MPKPDLQLEHAFDGMSLPLDEHVALALRQIAQAAKSASWSQWAERGLSPTQFALIEMLAGAAEGLRISELATKLGVKAPTVSDSVSTLEAKSLVLRQRDARDARATVVVLTTEGRRIARALAHRDDPVQSALAEVPAKDLEVTYRVAIQAIRALQEAGQISTARMCVRCEHFDPWRHAGTDQPHHCKLVDAPFGDRHLRLDCGEFIAAPPDTQRVIWARYVSSPNP